MAKIRWLLLEIVIRIQQLRAARVFTVLYMNILVSRNELLFTCLYSNTFKLASTRRQFFERIRQQQVSLPYLTPIRSRISYVTLHSRRNFGNQLIKINFYIRTRQLLFTIVITLGPLFSIGPHVYTSSNFQQAHLPTAIPALLCFAFKSTRKVTTVSYHS